MVIERGLHGKYLKNLESLRKDNGYSIQDTLYVVRRDERPGRESKKLEFEQTR